MCGRFGLTILFCCAASLAAAQPFPEPLFVDLSPSIATAAAQQFGRLRPEVIDRRVVGMRLDRLFGTAGTGQRIALNVDAHPWTATLVRIDSDAAGFRSWVGIIDGVAHSHVVFTERGGVVSGLIDGVTTAYQVTTAGPGMYLLEQIDRARLRGEAAPLAASGSLVDDVPAASIGALPDDAGVIDVLLLYTPSARDVRGGTAGIQVAAAQIISDSNTAFQRSGITTRVRLAGVVDIPYTEVNPMRLDLQTLTNSPDARNLRNQYSADLVQLLVNSPDPATCGVAWLLQSATVPVFDAYSVADVNCLPQYTPTHEMAHNMGSSHAPDDVTPGEPAPPFPYSYGFKDPMGRFRTMMAYECAGVKCPRLLNFSNPNVVESGGPTGTSTQNNALSINNTAATVANWRQSGGGPSLPPIAPSGLSSEVNGTAVTLRWNAVPSATPLSYTLMVGTAPGQSNIFSGVLGNITAVSGVVPAGTYFWRLIAINAAGSSPLSPEAQFIVGGGCVAPAPPRDFNFSVSNRVVSLAWVPPATGAPDTYILEAGSFTGLADLLTVATGPAPGLVTPAPPGVFFVRIRAQNACGISAPSNEQMIVVP